MEKPGIHKHQIVCNCMMLCKLGILRNSSGGMIPSIARDEFRDWGFDVESLWGAYVRLRPFENYRCGPSMVHGQIPDFVMR